MKQLAIVTANNGFISFEMSYLRALVYGYQLRQLGNVNVKVVRVCRMQGEKY